jgi:hypothetical protein
VVAGCFAVDQIRPLAFLPWNLHQSAVWHHPRRHRHRRRFMPSYTTYFVEVTPRVGNSKPIKSPGFKSKDDAIIDLEAIRKAQKDAEWVDLEWLSMDGRDIAIAKLDSSSVGFF